MDKILQLLQDHALRTQNKSGLSTVQVCMQSALPYSEVRTHLKQLYKERKIYYREGINNTLFFSNQNQHHAD